MASPSGGGELWTASWRWWERRPRVAVGLAAPAPLVVCGASKVPPSDRHTQTAQRRHRGNGAACRVRGERLDAELGIRWAVNAGLDSWTTRASSFSLGVTGEQRLTATGCRCAPAPGRGAAGCRPGRWASAPDWRSAVRNEGNVWLARAGADVAGDGAPLALWSGAGTGQGRDVLLRAHPLLHDGIISDGVFGRQIVHGGSRVATLDRSRTASQSASLLRSSSMRHARPVCWRAVTRERTSTPAQAFGSRYPGQALSVSTSPTACGMARVRCRSAGRSESLASPLQRAADALLQLLTVAAAERQARPAFQADHVLPVERRLELADAFDVHDVRTVDAVEQVRIELLLRPRSSFRGTGAFRRRRAA